MAGGGFDRRLIVWDAATGEPVGEPLSGHDAKLESVAFSSDGGMLASGRDDGTVILWDLDPHDALATPLTGHRQAVWSVAFNSDGRMLASGSDHGTAALWDTATGRRLGSPLVARGKVQSVASALTAGRWPPAARPSCSGMVRANGRWPSCPSTAARRRRPWPSVPTAAPSPRETRTGRSSSGTSPPVSPSPSRRATASWSRR